MGISEIFGDSFGVVRDNPIILLPFFLFTVLITIVSVGLAGVLLIGLGAGSLSGISSLFTTGATPTMSTLLSLLPALLTFIGIIALIAYLVGVLVTGLYIAIAEQGFKKQRISLNSAFNVAKSAYLRLLGANLLYLIILIIVSLIFAGLFAGAALTHVRAIILLAGFLLLIIAIVVFVAIALLIYQMNTVVILEKRAPVDAVKRSIAIGKSKWVTILGVVVVAAIIGIIVSLISDGVGALIGFLFSLASPLLGSGIRTIIVLAIDAFLSSWLALVPVFFYHEYVAKGQRNRK